MQLLVSGPVIQRSIYVVDDYYIEKNIAPHFRAYRYVVGFPAYDLFPQHYYLGLFKAKVNIII